MPATTANTDVEEARRWLVERERRGYAPPERFRDFVARHNPTMLRFEHVPRLCSVVDRIVAGELPRVLVMMPPRYLKSETFSRLLGGFNARQNANEWTSIVSYGADLAWQLSEEARNYYVGDGGSLRRETGAKKRWRTLAGGGLWAAGVGGGLLGQGYHLGIVDDPTDPEKAHSPTYQRRWRDFWPQKYLSRQEPGARIVLVMQRLGVDDPIDFLFRREVGEKEDHAPEHWHVVVLDEIKSDEPLGRWDGPMGLPPTCTLEPDNRALGEIIAPSRFNLEQVTKIQRSSGPVATSSQRQQRPMAPTGEFWKKEWFRTYKDLPANAYNGGRDWDTAYTKKEANSASAHVESYRGPGKDGQFPIYIHDVDWDWREFPELVEWMEDLAGPHYIEEKATGKSAVQALAKEGVAALEVPVKGDKFARASAVQRVVSSKRVWVREELIHTLLYGELQGLLRVTVERLQEEGENLDVNDVFVQAIARHIGLHDMRPQGRFG